MRNALGMYGSLIMALLFGFASGSGAAILAIRHDVPAWGWGGVAMMVVETFVCLINYAINAFNSERGK